MVLDDDPFGVKIKRKSSILAPARTTRKTDGYEDILAPARMNKNL
jgi:hypothetical protein